MDFKSLYSPNGFHEQGNALLAVLERYLQEAVDGNDRALHWESPEDQLAFWTHWQTKQKGRSENEVIVDFAQAIGQYTNRLQHPYYIGHQVAPPLPIAALTNLIGGLSNNGSAVYEMGMAPTAMERIVIDALCDVFGFGKNGRGFLTSGGTLANLTALLAARRFTATEDIWKNGMTRPIGILVSEQAHYCIDRAARIMGLGDKGILTVPVKDDYTMDTTALEEIHQKAISDGIEVIAVVGSAPSTSTGNYDDLESIGRFAQRHNIWFHVDAAHGGPAIFSDQYRHLMNGCAMADSLIVDGHKMMLMPSLTTALLFKNGNHAYENFNQRATYLLHDTDHEDWYNGAKKTFECTKNMMPLPWYLLMTIYGNDLFDAYVTRQFDLARRFAELLEQQKDFELPVHPHSNIVCFRYTFEGPRINEKQQLLREQLLKSSPFYLVQTNLSGTTYLRISLMNPLTTIEHLETLLNHIRSLAKS